MDRVYKEERNYILGMVKKIKASGCNVLLIQKSILRDAVTDLSLHYLVSRLCTVASRSCASVRQHMLQHLPVTILHAKA
jgi:chaperonin GroEL (HSP60 family)